MSNRIKGLTVAFEKDTHEDSAERIRQAILCIAGVANVKVSVSDHDDWMNRQQVTLELKQALWKALEEKT